MFQIEPISQAQQQQVIARTQAYIDEASRKLGEVFEPIAVLFDLKGKAAGMYKVNASHRVIRYNPYLFARYFEENINTTVPHEVAHYIVDMTAGMKNTRAHGQEWKAVMSMFAADASVTCNFELEGIPGRYYQRFDYQCACRQHQLTKIRHNRILKGVRYLCRVCQQELSPLSL